MKKMRLTVSELCHEDWDQMAPKQRGRYCAVCKKTVVDFNSMNDRKIIDFFKKPEGSVFGRFYKDQLNRPITIPSKRFTLPKYFFRYTWPALLLFLKACHKKEEPTSEVVGVVLELKVPDMHPMIGKEQKNCYQRL